MSESPPLSATAPTQEPPEHRLAVFMFTDLLGSSDLKVRLGDIGYATKVARPHNQLFRAALARFAGAREVAYTGDGFVVIFRSVVDDVDAALLFHQALRTHRWEVDGVQTRIGIHLGETVILAEADGAELTMFQARADVLPPDPRRAAVSATATSASATCSSIGARSRKRSRFSAKISPSASV